MTVNKNNPIKSMAIPAYIKNLFDEVPSVKQAAKELTIDTTKLLNKKTIYLHWVDMDTFAKLNDARYFAFMVEALNVIYSPTQA